MGMSDEIKKQKQTIARHEQTLAQEKLKKRRADTRRKIELGGLVIKSGMDGYSKSVILGALAYALNSIQQDDGYESLFASIGEQLFLEN